MGQLPATGFDGFLARLEAGRAGPDDADLAADSRDMPPWLAQVVAVLFDGQDVVTRQDWARRVHDELCRLDGRVPFEVVHDWHARAVVPMLAEAAVRRGEESGSYETLRLLHLRALAGERIDEAEWHAALCPVMREVYRHAYAYADAYATAHANAHAYALANGYGADEAVTFADTYATINTDANVQSYTDANAVANAAAMAAAFATADACGYAEAYPSAWVQACARAQSEQGEAATAYRRLADSLADSLGRVGAHQPVRTAAADR